MSQHRSTFLHGLSLTLRRLPAVLWAFVFNLGLAIIFSLRTHYQFAAIMNHSFAAQRLIGGFDLGTVAEAINRLHEGPDSGTGANYGSLPLYFILYFILVPGTLFCYQTSSPARLSLLLHQGLLHFWRFVRITIFTLLGFGLILGPLIFLQGKWADHVNDHAVGFHAFLATMAGYFLVFLVATILRLYFDLVEVYTVQLGLHHHRRNGKPDRRVRRAFGPAWRALRHNFAEAWPVFLFLTLIGAAAVLVTARISVHMLAQPRVWPAFILSQIGLFILLFTRFWQRAAETSLVLQHPIPLPPPMPRPSPFVPSTPAEPVVRTEPILYTKPIEPAEPVLSDEPTPDPLTPDPLKDRFPESLHDPIHEPISDPEPAAPSLDEPDPGIYHRNPNDPPE
jgi:hypothetical protein